jgi:hypothetical protein
MTSLSPMFTKPTGIPRNVYYPEDGGGKAFRKI